MASRSHQRLVLPLDQPGVETVLERVSGELGWALERQAEDRLQFDEDPTRLHCHCAPLRATVHLDTTSPEGTEVTIEGRVPGWGPIATRHAREQTELLARRIGLTAVGARRKTP